MATEVIAENVRVCSKCKQEKSIGEFGKAERNPQIKKKICKVCVNDRKKQWAKENAIRNSIDPAAPPPTLFCNVCKQEKPNAEFGKRSTAKLGIGGCCFECSRKRDKKRYKDNPQSRKETAKWAAIKWKFGLSKNDWLEILSAQRGLCLVCEVPLTTEAPRKETSACLDHDHRTNKVRGLLCARCNQGIGLLQDSSAIVLRAAEYLKTHGR